MKPIIISHIISFCLAALLLHACSPKINRNLLSVFFDGVPAMNSDSVRVTDISPELSSAVNLPAPDSDSLRDGLFYHYPYKENYCNSCHDENSKSEMVMPEPDLCYSCHEDFSSTYNVVHGPAAGGYCTSCHHPHMSDQPKMLKRKGQLLCLYCHDNKMILKNPVHSYIGNSDCTTCHNPHGGNDRSLIR